MKILYIANARIPTQKAHGYQIMKMCESFASQNLFVRLVLPTRTNKLIKENSPFKYYDVKENFKIKKIKNLDPRFLLKFPQGIYIKFQSLFFILSLFFYLLFKKNKAEYIFYTRNEYLLPLLNLFSKHVVCEIHDLPTHKKYYSKYWRRCYKLITISQGLKNELVGMDINKNKILVARDGVDLEKFNIQKSKQEIRNELGLAQDKKIILYSGHLYLWKGADILAKAAKNFSDNVLFIFLGGSNNIVKEFKKKYNHKNILFLGYKERKFVPKYLESADILILPNSGKEKISISYTSPLKMFEYMASRVPIIASGLPSISEVLNEKNALLFKPNSVDDLTAKIKLILKNKELGYNIAQQSSMDVRQYTWQKRAQKIIKFIK